MHSHGDQLHLVCVCVTHLVAADLILTRATQMRNTLRRPHPVPQPASCFNTASHCSSNSNNNSNRMEELQPLPLVWCVHQRGIFMEQIQETELSIHKRASCLFDVHNT